ncbi:hypothetical protein C8J41_1303 [Sphingomonas sp. PP-CC-3G-468]|nr:hypothetical protein C8J41_1303 [Sphingomonas sp. PP-CC-3G-468]
MTPIMTMLAAVTLPASPAPFGEPLAITSTVLPAHTTGGDYRPGMVGRCRRCAYRPGPLCLGPDALRRCSALRRPFNLSLGAVHSHSASGSVGRPLGQARCRGIADTARRCPVRRRPTVPAGVGAGLGVLSLTLPSGKDQLHGLTVICLDETVSPRRDNHAVWTGQATTVRASGTRTGTPSVVATALSNALLTWFPRQLPGPLSVP